MQSKYITCLVVTKGKANPDKLIEKYSSSVKGKKRIKYRFIDSEKLRKNEISLLKEMLKNGCEKSEIIQYRLEQLENTTDFENYKHLVEGLEIDDNGDAWTDENEDIKFDTFEKARGHFSIPFPLQNGEFAFKAKKSDVIWSEIHQNKRIMKQYETMWKLFKKEKEPSDENEKKLYEGIKNMDNYFSAFIDMDSFISHNTSFFTYAYCDKDGWLDIDNSKEDSRIWINNYFNKFIEPLSEDSILTLYECKTL
jgi:hypothetical protein